MEVEQNLKALCGWLEVAAPEYLLHGRGPLYCQAGQSIDPIGDEALFNRAAQDQDVPKECGDWTCLFVRL